MFQKISKHVWYMSPDHRSDRPALGYIAGAKRAFAVDAGASKAHVELFYSQLEKNGLALPELTGISHYHWDHSYGAAFVHGMTVASDRCNRALEHEATFRWTKADMEERLANGEDIAFGYYSKLAEYTDLSDICVVPVDIELSGDMTVDLGGVTVQVIYCAGPHSDDHLIFYVPEDKVLFLSDASGKAMFSLEWEYDVEHPELLQDTLKTLPHDEKKLRPFVELLEGLDFTQCILGHADEILTKEALLDDLKSYL